MYQYEIEREIRDYKTVIILPGEEMLDENGDPMLDEFGEPLVNLFDENQKTIVKKSEAEILVEEQTVLNNKTAEIQAECDAYEAAKTYQLENGGPGPVADFEIMKICNEHDGEFEVVFKEEE
jgi:hypothetical protein